MAQYIFCISFLYLEIVSWKPEKNNDGVCFQISGNLKLNDTPLLLVNYHCLYSFFFFYKYFVCNKLKENGYNTK
jgi:hypothetical protein